ncbi:hypothetical protein QVD17_22632 [Tagetes erecta]|uniref:Uncharacterized protein n=1 Tax=Tagetes erecta TaxID=13708 RepID=A0AAD8KI27_TARER|nr:hypothetical protein QVD17_22632 [Tagetes erecta]
MSAVCGPHLQTSAEEEVDQTSAVCKKKTVLAAAREEDGGVTAAGKGGGGATAAGKGGGGATALVSSMLRSMYGALIQDIVDAEGLRMWGTVTVAKSGFGG